MLSLSKYVVSGQIVSTNAVMCPRRCGSFLGSECVFFDCLPRLRLVLTRGPVCVVLFARVGSRLPTNAESRDFAQQKSAKDLDTRFNAQRSLSILPQASV